MSETFINEIITNIIAAAIASAKGGVEGEGETTTEPAQEPTQVRTIRAYEINAAAMAEKTELNLPLRRICHLKMSYLTNSWPPPSPASTQYFESEVEMDVNESQNV